MKKVVITGGNGLLGKVVVEHFVNEGYQVVSVDRAKSSNPKAKSIIADLTQLGECYGILQGADAVIHLAAIPVAYSHPNEVTFQNNVMSTYNILEACAGLGIEKAVIASSESSYGICFAKKRLTPQYVPIDEDHPQLPEDCYGLSKVVNEATGAMFNRRTGMQVVALRIGNVITPDNYKNFPNFINNVNARSLILWSYIDARDAARACQQSIELDGLGSVAINLANNNTSMNITNDVLMKENFPEVTDIRVPLDNYNTLLSNKRAKELLKWEPIYNWRDEVE